MRVLVATDAWHPQINGVVRSLEGLARAVPAFGAEIVFLTPEGFRTVPLPSYPEIRLALATPYGIKRRIEALNPTHFHVATEGPIGLRARRYCMRRGIPFTTSYHTRFPEYVAARAPVPDRLSYALIRRFHNAGNGIMVATQTLEDMLAARGFERIMRWSRGVDIGRYHPRPEARIAYDRFPRPIFLNVGRVAIEKNLEAFLGLDLPGSKIVVGEGPQLEDLKRRYPSVHFLGPMQGEDLARAYAGADVFVFPSRTDTFGLVLIEALASGLPVAAYPVMGPIDVIGDHPAGRLHEDLRTAALAALEVPRQACLELAQRYTWEQSARQFLDNVQAGYEDWLNKRTVRPKRRLRRFSRGAPPA